MASVRERSNAFCSALNSGVPFLPSTTISPSSHALFSFRLCSAFTSAGIFADQSWPPRVISRTWPSSMRAISR